MSVSLRVPGINADDPLQELELETPGQKLFGLKNHPIQCVDPNAVLFPVNTSRYPSRLSL